MSSARPRRILWHSANPWAPTSFGAQTSLMVRSLRALGHEVIVSSYGLDWGAASWDGHPVLPAGSPSIGAWADDLLRPDRGDLIVTLLEAHRLYREDLRGRPVLSWIPMEADPLEADLAQHFRSTGNRPVAVSQFGRRLLDEAGLAPSYAPHGIDDATFRPLAHTRAASRRAGRRTLGLPEDRFLVGVVGTNGPRTANRKSFPEIFAALALIVDDQPDVDLYLHTRTDQAMGGYDLAELAVEHLGPDVLHPDRPGPTLWSTPRTAYMAGLPPADLAAVYNALDVLCLPSAGEGFCLAMVEAQACGVPVVASDFSAQPENLVLGRLVAGQRRPVPGAPEQSFFTPSVTAIADAVTDLRQAGEAHWEEGVAFGRACSHDRRFAEHWIPLLDAADDLVG